MILVFSKEITPRLEYTIGLIFRDILGTDAEITSAPDVFCRSDAPKINYSDSPIMARGVRNEREEKLHTGLFLRAAPLLFDTGVTRVDPQPIPFKEETGFFETSTNSFLPFDPFASTFLVVSRMEEYLPGPRDHYGRFPARASLLQRYGLLEKPVVNRWALLIAAELEKHYGTALFPERKFSFLPTIDIDNAWAYRHKGAFRTLAGLGKEALKGEFRNFRERLRVLTEKEKDPYDTYDYLKKVFKHHEPGTLFFFLVGDYAKYDKQVSWKNSHFRQLISHIGQCFPTGIHPSFRSSEPGQQERVKMEKERLESILGKKISRSRQHYLRIKLPDSYRRLIDAGISEDYTMGYPELPGFRAGICTPFYFFDLSKEKTTTLKIFPFQVMEATFLQYLNLHPSEALERIKTIMEEVREVGGMFSVIWHNESLGSYGKMEKWKNVFENMVLTGFRYADRI